LRGKGSGAGGNEDDNDDDDLDADFVVELPTDPEAAEAADEQRALMASFEMQRRDQSTRQLMAVERRAATDRLTAAQQWARHSASPWQHGGSEGGGETAAGGRPGEGGGVGEAREHKYPLPSFAAYEDIERRRLQAS
jgi:hypothetical protein